MGTVSHLFREIASGAPRPLSKVGLGYFVNPDVDGGALINGLTPLVTKTNFMGSEYLFYPSTKPQYSSFISKYYLNTDQKLKQRYHIDLFLIQI